MLFSRLAASALVHRSVLSHAYNFAQPTHAQCFTVQAQYQFQRFNHTTTNMEVQKQQDELISFWFNRPTDDWFFPPESLDNEIRTRYGNLITEARAGKLDDWSKTPIGALCLVVLLDQFPRNIFRGSGESFSSDNKALQVSAQAIAQHFDKELGDKNKIHQTVLYLPFMHAEDLVAQIAGWSLYQNLLPTCTAEPDLHAYVSNQIGFAKRHLDCVAQLGRFPKRNEAIGRGTTKEEEQYLKDNPAGF